jgi:uncharacterized protein YceH (UPF0502 family)
MPQSHVQDNPDLSKVNKSFIVNVNEQKYLEALKRRANLHRIDDLESRIEQLEETVITLQGLIESLDERLEVLEP